MFATIAVLSLGIGIGAATAVFTLIDAVLLRKLAVANPDELVILRWRSPATARMPAPSLSGNFTSNETGQFSTSFSLPTLRAVQAGARRDVRVDRVRRIHGVQRRDRRHVGVCGCAGGLGQLLRGARHRSRRGPSARGAGRSTRRGAGGRHQPCLLAPALRRPRRRDRQSDGRERDAGHDRRGIARRLSRHDCRSATRRS